jgi:addiction module HigA family antidote
MPVPAIHPGEHLSEELQALSMSAAELARNLSVPTNRITQILNGRRAITGDTALRLAHFFGTTPEFWLNLQNLYELRIAGQKAGKAIQQLPTLKSAAPAYDLQKLVKAITPKNRHREVDFGRAQGREFPRGARRTR